MVQIGDAAILAVALHCVVFDEHATRRPKRHIRDKLGADAVDAHRPLAHAAPRRAALVPLRRDLRPLRIRGENPSFGSLRFPKVSGVGFASFPLLCRRLPNPFLFTAKRIKRQKTSAQNKGSPTGKNGGDTHWERFTPKTEVSGYLLAFFEIFVVPKNHASATGSGPEATEPLSLFTARNSKSAKIPGVHARAWRGRGELFKDYGTPRVCASACAGIPLEFRF